MLKKMIAILLAVAILPAGALACIEIYVGSGMTEDGSTVIARLEEYETNRGWPKTFDIIPEGSHKAGEEYLGCYGFRWTFTHDSYSSAIIHSRTSAWIAKKPMRIRPISPPGPTAGVSLLRQRKPEKTWQRAQELLEEFLPLANSQDPR